MSSDNQYTARGPAAIGFQTDSGSIDYGVNAQGNTCGVYGESFNAGVGNQPQTRKAPPSTGVCGRADLEGVVGEGSLTGGSFGGVQDAPSNTKAEFGSVSEGALVGAMATGGFFGVYAGGFLGVYAESTAYEAIHGKSELDRGGVFESVGNVAQLQLIPSTHTQLPLSGRLGDLCLHLNDAGAPDLFLCTDDKTTPVQWRPVLLGAPQQG